MKTCIRTSVIVVCLSAIGVISSRQTEGETGFTFEQRDDSLIIQLDGRRLATYLFRHDKLTRPAFVNVHTPGGIQLTRNFPPRLPEDRDPGYAAEGGIIHPVMHAGIWIAFGNLHGQDYWRLKAPVRHDGFVEQPQSSGSRASFRVRNRYLTEDGQGEVCHDVTRYEFHRKPYGLLMLVEAEFSSNQDFYFGDQEESGLAVRVASPLRVRGGNGTIVNDRGERNGTEIWGKKARWVDYSGTIEGSLIGVMTMPSPANPRPCWIHARDYGLVVCNPFPRQPKERREPYVKTWVQQDVSYRLAYGIAIHETPAAEFDRDEVYGEYLELLRRQ